MTRIYEKERKKEMIAIAGQEIKELDVFIYLGGSMAADLKIRLSKARGAFVRLKKICCSINKPEAK